MPVTLTTTTWATEKPVPRLAVSLSPSAIRQQAAQGQDMGIGQIYQDMFHHQLAAPIGIDRVQGMILAESISYQSQFPRRSTNSLFGDKGHCDLRNPAG